MLAALGCWTNSSPSLPNLAVVEPSLTEQIAEVAANDSDSIHIVSAVVTDEDAAAIAKLTTLRVLLIEDSQLTAAGVECLSQLPALEHLRLRGRPLDDAALAAVANLKTLRVLNLPHGTFTDSGVQQLAALPKLVQLRLGSRQLTDQSLAAMQQFPALVRIHLLEAPITDRGLQAVAANKRLESLYLDQSLITEAGLRKLFAALPELHVHVNQKHADFDPQAKDHKH